MSEQTVEAAGLDPRFAEDFAGRWLEAWNSHEPERVLALMHEDCVYDDSAWPRTMRSHAEVGEFLDSGSTSSGAPTTSRGPPARWGSAT